MIIMVLYGTNRCGLSRLILIVEWLYIGSRNRPLLQCWDKENPWVDLVVTADNSVEADE